MVIDSGLFVGTLRHRRKAPISHAFAYPLFMALLDVDREFPRAAQEVRILMFIERFVHDVDRRLDALEQ